MNTYHTKSLRLSWPKYHFFVSFLTLILLSLISYPSLSPLPPSLSYFPSVLSFLDFFFLYLGHHQFLQHVTGHTSAATLNLNWRSHDVTWLGLLQCPTHPFNGTEAVHCWRDIRPCCRVAVHCRRDGSYANPRRYASRFKSEAGSQYDPAGQDCPGGL